MLRARRTVAEPRLELTPLMDVMFLLLTFFIFAFAVMVRLKVTDIRLPPATAGSDAPAEPAVTVTLKADGQTLVNDRPTPIERVVSEIRRSRADPADAPLVLAIDESASSGDLFRLMDALRTGGFHDLRFLRSPNDAAR